jgi:hypothetical protein
LRGKGYAQRFMGSVMEIPGSFASGDAGHAAGVGYCCAEWARSGCVAGGGQELKEDRRGMSPSVRGKRAQDLAGQGVQGLFAGM